MSDLVFYTNPNSRGRIVRWMLEEVGQAYETIVLGYQGEMKTPAYLAINPMGKVPALRHGGEVVTEGAAICAYLADAFPDAGLAPPPRQRASYYRWLVFAGGPLDSALSNQSAGFVSHEPRDVVMMGYGTFETTVETLAAAVSRDAYVAGARFTAADVVMGGMVGWGMAAAVLPRRPEFESYWQRVGTRPACIRAGHLDDRSAAGRPREATG
jgi:glutathione S-transferase